MTGQRPRVAVAVVGMAFRFPGADTPEEFWRIIRDGECRIRRFTDAELAAAGVPAESRRHPGFVGASGILSGISGFDADFFHMSAREATVTDPQHRLFLECAYHALENAGYPSEVPGTRIGVYSSTGYRLYPMQDYLLNNILRDPVADDWDSGLEVGLGNFPDFTATRTAFRLNLTGPAINIQAACTSSLAAVQLAAQSVLVGDCDLALAGSTAVHVPQVLGYRYAKGSVLSRSGRLRPFDAAADGTIGGTGVAAIVLKRLDRAIEDGDTIHGVIRGWGVNNDGARKTTFTAPSAAGQREAIRRALASAGLSADQIGYLETHGTGTLKGDPIEFEAATAAFREDTDRTSYCAIGAGKANIGHLDVCAGLAGLIRVLLVLKHRVIPPVAGFSEPNPALDLAGSPFYIPRTARPWPETGTPRLAALSSLGVGGTNVHMLVEEAPEPRARSVDVPVPGVVLVSGRSADALAANARALRTHLRDHPGTEPSDLVTTTAVGRTHLNHRLAVRGASPAAVADALDGRLDEARTRSLIAGVLPADPRRRTTRPAMLFTGQGGMYEGAAAVLSQRFGAVREAIQECAELHGGSLLTALTGEHDPAGNADGPAPVQPALFALQYAITRLWQWMGVRPCVVAGHSLGEYAALCAAGALSVEDGLRLTSERERLMRRYCEPGAMAAVPVDRRTAARLVAEVQGLELAAVNGQGTVVLAGPDEAVNRLDALLSANGVRAERLEVGYAFHTAAMDPLLEEYRAVLEDTAFQPVTVPFVSGLDGVERPVGWAPDADYLLRHVREPVRFDEMVRTAASGGAPLLEIGPHGTLSALARRELPDVRAVTTLRRGAGLEQVWDAVATLHCAGVEIGWAALLDGTDGRRITLPGYEFQHRTYWSGPEPVLDGNPSADESEMEQNMATADRVLRHVIELTARHLGFAPADITGESTFFDLGADSLQTINILRDLEQEYQVKVGMREIFEDASTPVRLTELIVRRQGGSTGNGTRPGPLRAVPAPEGPEPLGHEPLDLRPVGYGNPAPAPNGNVLPFEAASDPDRVTRQEVEALAQQVRQLARIQLQMMSQLERLLDRQPVTALNGWRHE
jgi:acyl carrier protein